MFEFRSLDFVLIGSTGPVTDIVGHPDFSPAALRRGGSDRFLLVVNWVIPPYQCIMVAELDPQAAWALQDTPQARCWQHFLGMSDEERRDRLKMIFSMEEGPWLVKKATPKKPAIIGRQLKTDFSYVPDRHFEITIDVSSGKSEQMITAMVLGTMKSVKATLGLMIEARDASELPEALLFCPSLCGLDTARLLAPEAPPPTQGAAA